MKKIYDTILSRHMPRWVVLAFDVSVVWLSYYIAYLLRTDFDWGFLQQSTVHIQAFLISSVHFVSFLYCETYRGFIRLTNQHDAFRIGRTVALSTAVIFACSFFAININGTIDVLRFPLSVVIIQSVSIFGLILSSRLIVRQIYDSYRNSQKPAGTPTLIYGAGDAGIITKQTIEREPEARHRIIGFLDDDDDKVGKSIDGVCVLSPKKALNGYYVEKCNVKEVIISIQKLSVEKKNEIVSTCLDLGLKVKQIPSVQKWIGGDLSYKQIKEIKIENLLEREPIKLDSKNVHNYIRGKHVMITGAAGSIGSEIARQVLHFDPQKVILVDQAETPLFELEQELNSSFPKMRDKTSYKLANVKDIFRMEMVFKSQCPNVIFHAAAYKHVPLMENNPYEAVYVNIFGTKTLADLAVQNNVERFVMVSTDKAVNPTNVMGASKRIAEMYTQALNSKQNDTQFITTRFGNVLGSNGSVIPIFKKQIKEGGPLTLTHKDIKRYFMTIPEACNLVLEAGAMGTGGEIFLFDMGEPVKIYDLARKMIKLSGLQVGKDIEIEVIGLRPGEKLFEELFTDKEYLEETHHPKILKASVEKFTFDELKDRLDMLSQVLINDDNHGLVRMLKSMVPEYKSENSEFKVLDKVH